MSISAESITKIYQAYLPEMIEIVIDTYEHYRNVKRPEGCPEYKVNRKKYKVEFWERVISEHRLHQLNPEHTIPFGRRLGGGQMPWPDLVRRLPGMIAEDYRLQNRFASMNAVSFSLGCFDGCDTPQKVEAATERWKLHNPEISGPQHEAEFCYELISQNWSTLRDDPRGRWLTATVLLRAIEQKGMEKLNRVVGSHLQELVEQIS
ncbi:hypothetical protein P4B35_20775 [Pontiellaceae bacterium B12227]|nr:hypothetical protein [Pontiellaceae bacterium B12227]